jgi:hypothetical protein
MLFFLEQARTLSLTESGQQLQKDYKQWDSEAEKLVYK